MRMGLPSLPPRYHLVECSLYSTHAVHVQGSLDIHNAIALFCVCFLGAPFHLAVCLSSSPLASTEVFPLEEAGAALDAAKQKGALKVQLICSSQDWQ